MPTRFRPILSALLLAAALGLPARASANPAATNFMQAKQTSLTKLLRESAASSKLHEVFDTMLDYDTLARESLGPAWNELSAEQRKEFQGVLVGLVRQSYTRNLRKTLKYKVEFVGTYAGKRGLVVKTTAKDSADKRQEPFTIDYALRTEGKEFRVVDIVTEGESMVGNYRRQFTRVIKRSGFPALIQKMKDKLAKGEV